MVLKQTLQSYSAQHLLQLIKYLQHSIRRSCSSFDIEDNTIDNFTGDGSTTIFNLSKEVPSSQDVLVTLDGVTQHPSDGSTTRSYSVINQALTFTFVSAPADGVAIQAKTYW